MSRDWVGDRPLRYRGMRFNPGSRLLIVIGSALGDEHDESAVYYEWTGSALRHLATIPPGPALPAMSGAWPALTAERDRPTIVALHLFSQVIGKVPTALLPWRNHGWHLTLHVTPRGLDRAVHAPGGCSRWRSTLPAMNSSPAPALGRLAFARTFCDVGDEARMEHAIPMACGITAAIEVEGGASQVTGLNLRIAPYDGLSFLALAVVLTPPLHDTQELGMLGKKGYQIVTLPALYRTAVVIESPKHHLHRDRFRGSPKTCATCWQIVSSTA